MRHNLLYPIRIGITLIAFLAFSGLTHAALYTAVASGSWNDPNTWGGTAPGYTLTSDQVVIPAGITVTLNNDLVINGATASLNVMGTLNATADVLLSGKLGTISGSGTMLMEKVDLATGIIVTYTGSLTAEELKTTVTNLAMTADLSVTKELTLASGVLNVNPGGSLLMTTGSDMVMSGGLVTLNGGTADLSQAYNVKYLAAGAIAGMELTGTGLNNVLVNVPSGSDVMLTSDMVMDGTLNLLSGNLNLNGNDLTMYGPVSATGAGYVKSTAASDIYMYSTDPNGGKLAFQGTTNAVGDLVVKAGALTTPGIYGELSVMDKLDLISGTLSIEDAKLKLNGILTGTGTLAGNANSELVVSATGGLSTPIKFDTTAADLKNLIISSASGSSVTLGSPLTIYGDLNLANNTTLKLADQTLTFEDLGTMTGGGTLAVTDKSGIVINSTAGMSSPLALSGSVLGALTVNTATGATVSLNDDLTIAKLLSLQNGTLDLNGNDLTINGNILAGGSGDIATTSASDIVVSSATSTAGALNFAGTTNKVNNFTVDMGDNQQTNITGDLTVTGELDLSNGILGIDNSTLTLDKPMTGSGQLYGGSNANLIMNGGGTMNFATGGQVLGSLQFGTNSGDTIYLSSNLTIEDTLFLKNGDLLWIGPYALTIGKTGTIVGSGFLGGDSTSTFVVNANDGIQNEINYSGESLGTLVLNSANNGTITIGDDLVISKLLNLQKGDLNLDEYDLTITGNIMQGATGTITSTDESDITIKTATGPTGALYLSSWGNTIGNLTVDIKNGGTLDLYTDAEIAETLNLVNGKLDIGNYELYMDSSALIIGANPLSYIIADTAGYLSMHVSKGTGNSVLFPIGTETLYAPYMATLAGTSNSGRIEANVVPNVLEGFNSGTDLSLKQPMVDMTWNVQADSVIKNMSLTNTVMWMPAAEVNGFDFNKAYMSNYNGTNWTTNPVGAATIQPNGMYGMSQSGMTSFSPIAVFGQGAVTDVHEISGSSKYIVYPNPAVNTVYINNATVSNDIVKADIVNINGQVLKSQVIDNSVEAINLDELNPGNYYIRISGKDTNEVKRFIKQ